jgi:hypothetical protein
MAELVVRSNPMTLPVYVAISDSTLILFTAIVALICLILIAFARWRP